MRNIFLFLRIYSTFLFFLFLMGVSLYLLFGFNKFHNAFYSEAANEITGKFSTQFNNISYYFSLKKTNDSLVKANERLYNQLRADFSIPDTASKIKIDSLSTDSLIPFRKYIYRSAKVVRNSVHRPNNYIVIHRGRKQEVAPDMGVIGPNGAVVGTILEVSENFAVVMSLLHSQSNVSARLQQGGETGTLVWNGIDPDILLMKDVSKSASIKAGDSVITSGFSYRFPRGILLGTVKDILKQPGSSTYTVRVNSAADFENLQFVYVIENLQRKEPDALLNKVKQ